MFDLEIDNLRLTLVNAAGHEHRVASIAERAMALLADRLDARAAKGAALAGRLNGQSRGMSLDLSNTSDEQAAEHVADACLNTLDVEAMTKRGRGI